jgi:hypothetical protein
MSEIRTTTTIEPLDLPSVEPIFSLATVLRTGGAASCVTADTANVVIGPHLPLALMEKMVMESGSARVAAAKLAQIGGLEVSQRQSVAIRSRVEALVAADDRPGIVRLARELVAGRQTRLQSQLTTLVAASCRAVGFTSCVAGPGRGLLSATKPGTRQILSVEVAPTKDGRVQLHLDADGFEGGACVLALDALESELRRRGVHCRLQSRRRKPSRPVSLGTPIRLRSH